ncbi:tetratricopeptide repeat protein [Larkinella insperata]|uniref:Tetratricopeptide repeat protein n=1 Tax=Larkinella insperata TaxID=332158 RepID=A0ABW3Q643_9BACT|nr:tetratricopeptide repeat protein [Larkinella insperata]
MEILVTAAVISYIIYLRYYADLRTKSEKERDQMRAGIELFDNQQYEAAFSYFDEWIRTKPSSSVAYLYRARCLRRLGKTSKALDDLKTGLGYDDTVVDLHLETGQILYEQQASEAAFQEFDKAVFHSHGNLAEPFHWRGLAFRQLNQPQSAQQDLERAQALAQSQQTVAGLVRPNDPFFDRKLLVNGVFILINSLVLLYVIKETDVVHWPYLLAAISAAAIGFAQPRKGWLLAILQVATLLIGYFVFANPPRNGGDRELELFSLYGCIGLTFVGSFVGGVLKRALGT